MSIILKAFTFILPNPLWRVQIY